MADQGDEDIVRAEGAEGGNSSDDEVYELVAIEEDIDTAWEAGEVHPKREFPRVGFGRSGQHPEALPPRVYLTDRSPSTGVQTVEPPNEQLLEERLQQKQGGLAAAAQEGPQQWEQVGQQERPHEQEQGGQASGGLGRRMATRIREFNFLSPRKDSPSKQK